MRTALSGRTSGRLGRAALMVMGLLAAGCPDSGLPCGGDEEVIVKMTGTCASGPRTFHITKTNCDLTIGGALEMQSDAGAPVPLGLPPRGAANMSGDTIREGGWSIWGCPTGPEPCPDQFRICTARRVSFQLNLTCIDGMGAPACEAVLTE